MEILMVTGLLAYIMNYIIGKNKNSRLAQTWFNSHRELLESNFSLVGQYHVVVYVGPAYVAANHDQQHHPSGALVGWYLLISLCCSNLCFCKS